MSIEFVAVEYTAEAGEYVYKLRAVADYWVVHRRRQDAPNIPPCWHVATAIDGWSDILGMESPMRFNSIRYARMFVRRST